jgi:excinuclease ABC subunit A
MSVENFDKTFSDHFKLNDFLNRKINFLLPLIRETEGNFGYLFSSYLNAGFLKVRVDGKTLDIVEGMKVDRNKKHNIDLVVDRFKIENTGECIKRLGYCIMSSKQFDVNKLILVDQDSQQEFFFTV